MLIALLAPLGVNLIAVLALAASAIGRKRWIKRQPGTFQGAIRVSEGEIDGFPEAAPRLRPLGPRHPGLDQGPVPVPQRAGPGKAAAKVAAHSDDTGLLLGPYRELIGTTTRLPDFEREALDG